MRRKLMTCLIASLLVFQGVFAQTTVSLGTFTDFCNSVGITKNTTAAARPLDGGTTIQVSENEALVVNLENYGNGEFNGYVQGHEPAAMMIHVSNNVVEGTIVVEDQKKAYTIYTEADEVFVKEISIDAALCFEYAEEVEHVDPEYTPNGVVDASADALQSLEGAATVVLLDFDGHVDNNFAWTRYNGNATINALPSGFNDAEIIEIWKWIAEDFRAFDINITTDTNVFNATPITRRIRNVFTPTNFIAAGGVAYVNSFANGDLPCWVFNGGVLGAAEAASHEVGHALGLNHDGRITPSEDYFQGHGNWAPIMGVGYYRGIVTWSKGEYASANNTEDDLAIITSTRNGIHFRTDDHANGIATATTLDLELDGTFISEKNQGVVETSADIDFFKFVTGDGTFVLDVKGFEVKPNLDMMVKIYNAAGVVLVSGDPIGVGNYHLESPITAGTYYISVEGIGEGDPLTNGYSDYASLGYYDLSGSVAVGPVAPTVVINAPLNNAVFNEGTNINVSVSATDADGSVVSVELFLNGVSQTILTTAPYTSVLSGLSPGVYTLRALATDNDGDTGFAEITFTVNALVTDCNGVLGGTAFIDDCNVCAGGNTGVVPNSTCLDCHGDVNGTASIDDCNVCSGGNTGIVANSTCTDCNGVLNGTAFIDSCNVCAAGNTGIVPNSTCLDCHGDINGSASIDDCNVCSGGNTGIVVNSTCSDCNGVPNGTAFIDSCNVCAGGNTGVVPNSSCGGCDAPSYDVYAIYSQPGNLVSFDGAVYQNKWYTQGQYPGDVYGPWELVSICSGSTDCNGVVGGSAFIDECGVCAGGNTGVTPNTSCNGCDAPQYNANTVYANAGTEVIFQGKVYKNKWYTQNQLPGDVWGPWEWMAVCPNAVLVCDHYSSWNAQTLYDQAGNQVTHNGAIYVNQWYTLNQQPGVQQVWLLQDYCVSASASQTLGAVVYPTVFGSTITVELPSSVTTANVSLKNYLNETLLLQVVGAGKTTLTVSDNIPTGVYYLHVGTEVFTLIKE